MKVQIIKFYSDKKHATFNYIACFPQVNNIDQYALNNKVH